MGRPMNSLGNGLSFGGMREPSSMFAWRFGKNPYSLRATAVRASSFCCDELLKGRISSAAEPLLPEASDADLAEVLDFLWVFDELGVLVDAFSDDVNVLGHFPANLDIFER